MRKRLIVIVIGIVLLISAWVGSVSAQDVPGYPVPGYPVETDTPTEVPTKPPETTPPPATPEPTQPPPNPTEAPPTWVPPQPTPTETPDVTLEGCPFTRVHPVLAIISEKFDVPFAKVAEMFCSEHMGIGEIVQYFENLQQPNGGADEGGLGGFPGHEGQGWGLFWRFFHRAGLPGFRLQMISS